MKNKLIHIIANDVSRSFVANGVLAYGASPIMSEFVCEFDAIHQHASALVISLGMPSQERMKTIEHACKSAARYNLPIGIDPVGIHLSQDRLDFFKKLLRYYPISYIRGNQDEILSFFESESKKSTLSLEASHNKCSSFFKNKLSKTNQMWIITGEVDYVIFKNNHVSVKGGHPVLRKLSGAGCLLTTLIGVCIAFEGLTEKAAVKACQDMKSAASTYSGSLGNLKPDLLSHLNMRGYDAL